jgi:tetratricopeptide (TPR) repeat protein
MASMLLRSLILAFLFLLNACAASGVREATQNSQLPRHHELANTPFYPQTLYHCGPAALATALNAVNLKVTPDQLVPEVYIPSREGSLQIEMLAAARRHGALAIKIAPTLEALLKEIAAGNVVLVMQNLGLSWAPSWHYAVVVGYDLDKELIWLRSGTFDRFEMTLSTFQRTWARSKSWAFVALAPGSLPAAEDQDAVVKALIAFEKTAPAREAKVAYAAAVQRWPNNLVLQMGLGNSAYSTGDLSAAATAFRDAIAAHPNNAAAHNNLANVLLAQGDATAAKQAAEKAMQLSRDQITKDKTTQDKNLQIQISKTLEEINAHLARKPGRH